MAFHFHFVCSRFPTEGVVLERGEKGVHFHKRGAMRRFQLLHGGDPAG